MCFHCNRCIWVKREKGCGDYAIHVDTEGAGASDETERWIGFGEEDHSEE